MLSSLQSGLIPGDSTVNQLTYLDHMFCEAWMLEKKYELPSVSSARLLIVSGTKDLYTNLKLLVSQERPFLGLEIISLADDNG